MVRVRACGLVAVFLERELLQVLFAPLRICTGSQARLQTQKLAGVRGTAAETPLCLLELAESECCQISGAAFQNQCPDVVDARWA